MKISSALSENHFFFTGLIFAKVVRLRDKRRWLASRSQA
jgi:hypothetical protein